MACGTSTADPAGRPLRHALPAVVVHTALRREFRLAGPLVRRVDDGDARRARRVADHLDFLLRGLHHHHVLEDELIWPVLRERTTVDVAPIVDVMQAQHDDIDDLVGSTVGLMSAWQAEARSDVRDPLADVLDALHADLAAHLDLEERVVLPLAEEHLTVSEWREIGQRAEADHARDERALSFGMLQYEGDPAVLATMLASAPRPVRVLVPRLARRAYRRHAVAIHGTPTP